MRIRLGLRRSLFFLAAFLFCMVALVPLRLGIDWFGLDDRGLAAREARGSIWYGGLSEAQLGALSLGDLAAELQLLPLAIGRARVELERIDEARRFEGAITVSGRRFGVDDVTGAADLGAAFGPLPLASLDLSDLSAHFEDGTCSSAEGLVRATVAGGVGGLALPGAFSGNARCDEGALLLPLVGPSGMEAMSLRLRGDGRYDVELAIRPTDPAMQQRLMAAGFVQGPAGYVLRASGEL